MTSADSHPLGPEDAPEPDRHAQAGETPAEYERVPGADRREGRSDVEDGAWRTEATFDEEGAPLGDGAEPAADEDEDVDPIVHRGE